MFISDFLSSTGAGVEVYPIGALIDFAGVPSYYNNGTTTWMQTGVAIAGSLLGSATKSNIRSLGANYTTMTDNAAFSYASGNYIYANSLTPLAKNANVCCVPYTSDASASSKSMTINAAGAQSVSVGAQLATAVGSYGSGLFTSDGTTIWSWAAGAGSTSFAAWTTTDGITWSTATLTGQAAFTGLIGNPTMGPSTSYSNFTRLGELWGGQYNMCIAAYCGARHLLIGSNASTQYLAQRSTNGLAWGGDETTTILGSATIAEASWGWWNTNGLNFFIALNSIARFSGDGGVTWAAATGAPTASAQGQNFRKNASDPARIIGAIANSTTLAVTTNSGSSWTARTAPLSMQQASTSLCGRGSTWGICDGATNLAYRSTDDCATWTAIPLPSGFVGPIQGLYSDANRFYLVSAACNQVATSTDLITWVVQPISNAPPLVTYSQCPENMVATDTNTIMGAGQAGVILYSNDGGVTWWWSSVSSDTGQTGQNAKYYAVSNAGQGAFIAGTPGAASSKLYSAYVLASNITAGGKGYRVTTSAITPLRSGAATFARIA